MILIRMGSALAILIEQRDENPRWTPVFVTPWRTVPSEALMTSILMVSLELPDLFAHQAQYS
jgi:hypothetical protein